jgi:ATP-dependent Zn protease
LIKRRSELERIAQELIQKETLEREQLEKLLDYPLQQKPA